MIRFQVGYFFIMLEWNPEWGVIPTIWAEQVSFRYALLPVFIVNPIDKFAEEWYSDIIASCKESIVRFTFCTDTNDYIKERCE